jgi:hypothetical protein
MSTDKPPAKPPAIWCIGEVEAERDRLRVELAAAQERIVKLIQLIDEYGSHHSCSLPDKGRMYGGVCDCGFDAKRAAAGIPLRPGS